MSDQETINKLYRELLGRDADPVGLSAHAGLSEKRIRASILSSPEYQTKTTGSVAPVQKKEGTGKHGMTHETIMQEWNRAGVGRPITQDEYNNWMRYGRPGQLATELGGGMQTVTGKDSKRYKIYTDTSMMGEVFDWLHEGEVAGVPEGTPIAKGYKIAHTQDGYSWVYKPEEHGGIMGKIADVTGIKELKTEVPKWIPKEIHSVGDVAGLSSLAFGTEGTKRAVQGAKNLGLKAEDYSELSRLGSQAAFSVADILTGGATVPAHLAVTLGQQAGDVAIGKKIEDALKEMGVTLVGAKIGNAWAKAAYNYGTNRFIFDASNKEALQSAGFSLAASYLSRGKTPVQSGLIHGGLSYLGSEDLPLALANAAVGYAGPKVEEDFQKWYGDWVEKIRSETNMPLGRDPDDPNHFYDYRAAYHAGKGPSLADDGKYHWPSQYKADDHPNRFVRINGVIWDTKYDVPAPEGQPEGKLVETKAASKVKNALKRRR